MGEIEVAGEHTITITGTLLDCDQQPVVEGLVIVRRNNTPIATVLSDETGHFSATILSCTSSSTISVSAFDEDNLLQSLPFVFEQTGSTLEVGNIPVCTILDEYISLHLNGTTTTFPHNLQFNSLGNGGSVYGERGVDTVFVSMQFENYQNLQADVSSMLIYLKAPDQSLINYTCQLCTGTGAEIKAQFTEFPATAGQYAVGSVSGFVMQPPNSTLIPYSLYFRIKKQ